VQICKYANVQIGWRKMMKKAVISSEGTKREPEGSAKLNPGDISSKDE